MSHIVIAKAEHEALNRLKQAATDWHAAKTSGTTSDTKQLTEAVLIGAIEELNHERR